MKKLILYTILLSAAAESYACDACGCNLGGMYFGILPQYSSHFIGLRYSQASFRAAIRYNSDYLEDEYSEDTYQKYEMLGRIMLPKRFQLHWVVPYLYNTMNGSHQNVILSGVGDPSLLVYYNPFNSDDELIKKRFNHSLLLGGGVKFPLGKFDKKDGGELINRNFQTGSGSFDYLLSLNYTVKYKKAGVNIESAYKLNTQNRNGYRFGNQFNISSSLFYWIETPYLAILPYTGILYEAAEMHTDEGISQVNTGGSALLGSAGTQLYHKALTLNISYQHPLAQAYNSDHVTEIESNGRLLLSILFNFSLNNKE